MNIFVSYARQDTEVVNEIRDALGRLGHEVWMDRELRGGQQWWDAILSRIRECDVFMFALSPDSAKSKACPTEIAYAVDTDRPLLPVMVTTTDVRVFPKAISDVQFVDYTARDSNNSIVDLISALTRLPPETPPPDTLPQPPPAPGVNWEDKKKQLSAESLSFKEQAALLTEIRASAGSEEDTPILVDLLREFRRRPDIVESVGQDIDRLLGELGPLTDNVSPTGSESDPTRGSHDESDPPEEKIVVIADPDPPEKQPEPKEGEIHRFVAPGTDLVKITNRIENWLSSERMESQTLLNADSVVVQGRSAGKFGRAIGAGTAFSIKLWTEDDDLVVEIGQMKWADKGAAAAVGIFIFLPALIPAAVGSAKQAALPKKVLRIIEDAVRDPA